MKNLNKVRDSHPVGKVIYFNDKEEALRFIDLYKDLFFVPKDGPRSEKGYYLSRKISYYDHYCHYLWITIFKEDWKNIEADLKLERVNKSRSREYYFKN